MQMGNPTPWWETKNGGYSKLQESAPEGYEYDPVQMAYTRTPQSAGNRAAQFTNAAVGNIPSLTGLIGTPGAPGAPGAPGGPGGGAPGAGGPVSGGAGVPHVDAPDMTASNNAIFAQAKDKVGQQSRASLDSLAGELGSQGMLGGGAQVQATRDVVNNNAGELGQVTRDLATKNSSDVADFKKMGYQGDITQRGQDIQSQEANARLALEQRAQQYQLLDLILKGIGGGSGGGSYGQPTALY